jgi:hypothetical protein
MMPGTLLKQGPGILFGGNLGRVGFDTRSFFPWDGRSPEPHPTCDIPFPARSLVLAKACHMAKRRLGYSTRRHMLEPVRPEAVLPDRALYLPTLSHFLIVNITSLSRTLSLHLGYYLNFRFHATNLNWGESFAPGPCFPQEVVRTL